MRSNSRPGPASGFTLAELAVVLAILTLLTSGLLVPVAAQYEARNIADTRRQLNDAREALIGFAIAQGYFPCPANAASNGLEAGGRTSNQCNNQVGLLPWATLGIPRLDAWGRQFRYSISKEFTNNSTTPAAGFSLTQTMSPNITIKGENGIALTSSNTVVAVILSHGRNGYFAVTDAGTVIANDSTTNSDEQENGNAFGTTFHDRSSTANTAAAGGEIDDLVVWVSANALMHRMVVARRLP